MFAAEPWEGPVPAEPRLRLIRGSAGAATSLVSCRRLKAAGFVPLVAVADDHRLAGRRQKVSGLGPQVHGAVGVAVAYGVHPDVA